MIEVLNALSCVAYAESHLIFGPRLGTWATECISFETATEQLPGPLAGPDKSSWATSKCFGHWRHFSNEVRLVQEKGRSSYGERPAGYHRKADEEDEGTVINLKSIALNAAGFLVFASCSVAQNYTITLYSQPNGTGNVVMTYTGPMLSPTQNGTVVHGFVTNPAAMPWNTPPIAIDGEAGSLNPCYALLGNGGPNGEASITCESAAPGTTNGVPLFSFCPATG